LTIHRGTIHEYLGMTIDYSEDGKVKFIMKDYIESILEKAPCEMDGTAITPTANHLFKVNENAKKLDNEKSDIFHRLTAKILYCTSASGRGRIYKQPWHS